MISTKFIVFLTVGTLAMLFPLLICGKWNDIKAYKCLVLAVLLTIVGTLGTYLMGFVENQFRFGSRSFFGAVFLIPAVFPFVSKMLRMSYRKVMDMSAPAVCVMLVLMKILCVIEGCCGGRELFVNRQGVTVAFPSQIVELSVAAILVFVLLWLNRSEMYAGNVYAWFLVLYGVIRFILNFFRAKLNAFVWIFPPGHFWSLVAIVVGVIWIKLHQRVSKRAIKAGAD